MLQRRLPCRNREQDQRSLYNNQSSERAEAEREENPNTDENRARKTILRKWSHYDMLTLNGERLKVHQAVNARISIALVPTSRPYFTDHGNYETNDCITTTILIEDKIHSVHQGEVLNSS